MDSLLEIVKYQEKITNYFKETNGNYVYFQEEKNNNCTLIIWTVNINKDYKFEFGRYCANTMELCYHKAVEDILSESFKIDKLHYIVKWYKDNNRLNMIISHFFVSDFKSLLSKIEKINYVNSIELVPIS